MYRWDIINYLISKYNYKKYLEIGYYKGWSFDNIICESKTAVDPNPCKTLSQQESPNDIGILDDEGTIWKMTSDDFFEYEVGDQKYDIIFIDGLHESGQVYKDIMNAVDVLNEGGTIVLHDCNPPEYEHTTTGIDGAWTGDTYKGFIKYRRNNWHIPTYTIDTDWGIGIIKPFEEKDFDSQHTGILEAPVPISSTWDNIPDDIGWEFFDKYRVRLLNLKPTEKAYDIL